MKQQFETPVIEIYKGYEIRTTPNGEHFASLIYKGNEPVGGTFSDARKANSIDKAKAKIDNYNG